MNKLWTQNKNINNSQLYSRHIPNGVSIEVDTDNLR